MTDLSEHLARAVAPCFPVPPETALSATQGGEPGPGGLCSCFGPQSLAGCVCEWGELIRNLQRLAYHMPADRALVELPHVQMQLVSRLSDLRRAALRRRAADWTGSVNEFLRRFELTRSNYDRLDIKIPKDR